MSTKQRIAGWSVFIGELAFLGVMCYFIVRYLS